MAPASPACPRLRHCHRPLQRALLLSSLHALALCRMRNGTIVLGLESKRCTYANIIYLKYPEHLSFLDGYVFLHDFGLNVPIRISCVIMCQWHCRANQLTLHMHTSPLTHKFATYL